MKATGNHDWAALLILPFSFFTFVAILTILSPHSHDLIGAYPLQYHAPNSDRTEHELPQKSLEFFQHDQFWDMGQQGEDAWASLLPSNGGFLRHLLDNGTSKFSGVSMFHQLHCLQILRSTLVASEQEKPRSQKQSLRKVDHSVDPHVHWAHCLDYLRQSITCFADPTIEPAIGDGTEPIVNGWHVKHQCRDSESIYKMAAAHM